MKKKLARIRISFNTALEYRAEMPIWFLVNSLPTLVFIIIWQLVYKDHTSINGLTLKDAVYYQVLAYMIVIITGNYFENLWSERIRNGFIDTILIKPMSFISNIFCSSLGGKLMSLIFYTPALIIILIIVNINYGGIQNSINIFSFLQFVFLIIFAYYVEFLLSLIVTFLTFFIEGAEGLRHFKWLFISLLSGVMMPIVFLPSWLQKIINILPFKYLYYIPIQIISKNYIMTKNDYINIIISFILLTMLTHIIYKKGIIKYTSAA